MKQIFRAGLALILFLMPVRPGFAQGFDIPLINGFAEDGPAAADSTAIVSVPGWETAGNFTVVAYGTPGPFPSVAPDGPLGNQKFFTGGPGSSHSTAMQLLAIPEACWPDLAMWQWWVFGSADMGGWASSPASPSITITVLDGAMQELTSLTIGPVTPNDRGQQTRLVPVMGNRSVPNPSQSRFVRVTIEISGPEDGYNCGFVDNISVDFVHPDPVLPTTWSLIKSRFMSSE
jgi:hypothetical protein